MTKHVIWPREVIERMLALAVLSTTELTDREQLHGLSGHQFARAISALQQILRSADQRTQQLTCEVADDDLPILERLRTAALRESSDALSARRTVHSIEQYLREHRTGS